MEAPTIVTPPVSPPVTVGADHLKVVPAGTVPFIPLVGVMAKETPLQVVDVMALIIAIGLMVTVKEKTGPAQYWMY